MEGDSRISEQLLMMNDSDTRVVVGGGFIESWNSVVDSMTYCRNLKDPDVKNVQTTLAPPSWGRLLSNMCSKALFFFFEGGCKQTAKHVVFLDLSLC